MPFPQARPIGVVGGVGPQAGLDLVRKVLAATRAVRDQDHLPITLASFPGRIPDRTAFLLGQTGENPGEALAEIASGLVEGGAEVIGIPCNTAHAPSIFQQVERRLAGRCHLVHMVEEVGLDIHRQFPDVRTVGILSTTGTLVSNVYPERLRRLDLEVLQLPRDRQEATVQPALYDATYGIKSASDPVHPRAVEGLRAGLDALLAAGAEVVVLACTEIPLALRASAVQGVPLLDATRVLARALVRQSCPEALADA